ncbi:MAG: DUF502 domain-containing protein [Candidatus Omnitrophica bacterium]|nr:DUF502 domain-containing protein [Candidatus Omnitrophota bacterium]
MLTKIRNTFITGIAVILPTALSIIIIRFLFIKINSWLLNPLTQMLKPYLSSVHAESTIKAVIFLLIIGLICLIGWAANILVIRRFFSLGENILLKIPMFGRIYNAVRQISTAFLGQGKNTIFKRVVLFEYPRKGIYSIGFLTGEGRGEIQNKTNENVVNVFVPTTPNPTSGIFLVVPKEQLIYLKMSVEEGMKMVISGGAVSPSFEEKA